MAYLSRAPIAVLTVLLTATAVAQEASPHTIVEAAFSEGTALDAWALHHAFGLSVLRLNESGQGFGARVTLMPHLESQGAWEVSADGVARLANDGPLYLKLVAGGAWAPGSALWPPRVRAGTELGLTGIRGGVGTEVGISAIYTFPPSLPKGGEWVVSARVSILFGFGERSRVPAAPPLEDDPSTRPPAENLPVPVRGETQSLGPGEKDVISHILLLRKPGAVMDWWNSEDVQGWTHPLSEWENKYIEVMSSPKVPEPIRMWAPVTPETLTPKQFEEMEQLFGKEANVREYCNWANRHRILKHYFGTHPATVNLLVGLYRFTRDSMLLFFALERGWQVASGREMFSREEVSRLGATVEFFAALGTAMGGGKLLKAARPGTEPVSPEWLNEVASPGEELGSLESLVDAAVGDTPEVLQAKLAMEEALSPGARLPRNVEVVRQLKPSVDRPRADVPPDSVRWKEYCNYYERRLAEMEVAENAGELESVDPPHSWSSYQTLRDTFARGIKYQRARMAALRAMAANGQLPGFTQPHLQSNAGVFKVDLRYADALVIELQRAPGQPLHIETYSFKSCDFKLLKDPGEVLPLMEAHARQAVQYYGGELNIRTPEIRRMGGVQVDKVKVDKVHLVYDAELMPNAKNVRQALLDAMKEMSKKIGVEVRFE